MKKNDSKPLVSVVIPVFNGASYLVEAVSSVQKSTYRNFEILLVDDGSTDKSKQVCRILARTYRNIRYFDFPANRGMDKALNLALAKAKGEFICRLNQDDLMVPSRITKQVNYLRKHPQVVAVGSTLIQFTDKGDKETINYLPDHKKIINSWLYVSPFADPAVMYLKSKAVEAGGYEQKYWPADDIHLWYRLGKIGELANIQEPLTKMRVHDKMGSSVYFRTQIRTTFSVHRWAHRNIQKASFPIQMYWLMQLLLGLVMTPRQAFRIYRLMKKLIYTYEGKTLRLKPKIIKIAEVMKVIPQPIIDRTSGVYKTISE